LWGDRLLDHRRGVIPAGTGARRAAPGRPGGLRPPGPGPCARRRGPGDPCGHGDDDATRARDRGAGERARCGPCHPRRLGSRGRAGGAGRARGRLRRRPDALPPIVAGSLGEEAPIAGAAEQVWSRLWATL
jgi:hypothetical protein